MLYSCMATVGVKGLSRLQVIKRQTNDDVPCLGDSRELVGTAHLGVGDSANDEDDETRSRPDTGLACDPLFMPLAVPRTDHRQHDTIPLAGLCSPHSNSKLSRKNVKNVNLN